MSVHMPGLNRALAEYVVSVYLSIVIYDLQYPA